MFINNLFLKTWGVFICSCERGEGNKIGAWNRLPVNKSSGFRLKTMAGREIVKHLGELILLSDCTLQILLVENELIRG